jgi:hypothetical protein
MSFANRMFQALEAEINRNLEFSFTIVGGPNRIPVLKTFSIRVWMRNNGPVALTNIRGAVRPTTGVHFAAAAFSIARLCPREEHEIASIDVIRTAGQEQIVDCRNTKIEEIAVVNVTGQPDLQAFWFRDVARAVRFVQPGRTAIPVEGDPGRGSLSPRERASRLARRNQNSSWLTGDCIPLSRVADR